MTSTTKRLESLDILRGLDLFCIVALESIMRSLDACIDASWFEPVMWCFTHVAWEGFSPWDLIMPLFMFMSGVSIPFALSRYKREGNKRSAYKRIAKRFVLLWVFGMMCQGNLLGLNPDYIYLYTNTLQSIAVGYVVASLLYLNTSVKVQVGVAVGLLVAFWACMEFIQVGDFGGGCYTPSGNFAEWVDRVVLGRFRDGAMVRDGQVVFASWYTNTWILSNMTFCVTTLSGLFAGYILRDNARTTPQRVRILALIGLCLVAAGWLWHLQMPVIKRIWTSSMVLVSSGYSFLLMALFHWLIDHKGCTRYTSWLKIYGMNSIAAYMLVSCINFSSISNSLLYGLQQYVGDFYPVIVATCNSIIIYQLLRLMYKHQVFLKV